MLCVLSVGRRGDFQRVRIRRRPRNEKKYDEAPQHVNKEVQHQRRGYQKMASISR